MNKRIKSLTQDCLERGLGFPLNFKFTPWRQKGNQDREWSWHRSGLFSQNSKAPPKTHTTRFSFIKTENDELLFGIRTTHAPEELDKYLQGLSAGGAKSNLLLKRLKRAGFTIRIYTAFSNSEDELYIRTTGDAKAALSEIKRLKVPWYDFTCIELDPDKFKNQKKWEAFLVRTLPFLQQIFWLHLFGKNYWNVTSKTSHAKFNSAHTNKRLKTQLIKQESERCQNTSCRNRNTHVVVAHLNPHKKRDELSNVILLCGTCHNLQKPQAVCRVSRLSKTKKLYKVNFEPRNNKIKNDHWMIQSNHKIK